MEREREEHRRPLEGFLMERQRAASQRDIGPLTPSESMTQITAVDTTCLWKDNPVFLISLHICFDIGSRSVKPSRMMEQHGLWRRASEGERERAGECE